MKRARAALKGGVVKLIASRDYRAWINDLRKRYRAAQTKAAVSVNSALLEFYWNLGKDISEKYAATQYYGSRFFECVSKDLTDSIQNPQGLSVVNIRYCQRFYDLYSGLPNLPQLVEELVSIPWVSTGASSTSARETRKRRISTFAGRSRWGGAEASLRMSWRPISTRGKVSPSTISRRSFRPRRARRSRSWSRVRIFSA